MTCVEVKFTGLTQHSQVDPAFRLKIPIRALALTQSLGQPWLFHFFSIGSGVWTDRRRTHSTSVLKQCSQICIRTASGLKTPLYVSAPSFAVVARSLRRAKGCQVVFSTPIIPY
jgi:hypothetical protein